MSFEQDRCRTYVQMIGPGGFFAVCGVHGSDGFPSRWMLADAESDARSHGRLEHAYPEHVLRDHEKPAR